MRTTVVRIGVAATAVFAGMSGALTAQGHHRARSRGGPAAAPVAAATPVHQVTPVRQTRPAGAAARPTLAARFTTGTEYRVTAPTLNVRSGPGMNHRVVDGLDVGHRVFVQETEHNWSKIGPDQWVSASYLARQGVTHSTTHTITHRVHYRIFVTTWSGTIPTRW